MNLDERWLFDLAKDSEGRKPIVTWQTYNWGGALIESYDEMFISLLPLKGENPELRRVLRDYFHIRSQKKKVWPEDYKAFTENPFVLDQTPVPLFYSAACDDVNTVAGFAIWVQDWEYTTCPHCRKPMKYLAQIQWDTVYDGAEGTLYVEFCPDCHIISMQHQQT